MVQSLVTLIIYLLIIGVILILVQWVLSQIGLPEPIAKIVWIVLVVLAALIIIVLLLNLVGAAGFDVPKISDLSGYRHYATLSVLRGW